MNIIGRYDKVRSVWTTGQIGYPFIIDNKWMELKPVKNEEWWKSPDGYYIPVLRGGIGGQSGYNPSPSSFLYGNNFSAPALTGIAINAASGYTFGSAGNAIGFRIKTINTFTIANIYYYISAINGTQANVNTVDLYIRNNAGTITPIGSGATIYASASVNPNNDSPGAFIGWHKIAVSPTFTFAPDQFYWIIFTRTQNATDFPTLGRNITNWTINTAQTLHFTPTSTTDGFNTITFPNEVPTIILEDPNGNVFGNSLTQTSTDTAITRKGLKFVLSEQLRIFGMILPSGSAGGVNGLEIYDHTNAVPGNSPLKSSTSAGTTTGNIAVPTLSRIQGCLFRNGFLCSRNVPYRLVTNWANSGFSLTLIKIGQNNSYVSQTRAAKLGGSNWYFTKANGTTDWSNDDQDSLPMLGVLMDDQVASNIPTSRIFGGY